MLERVKASSSIINMVYAGYQVMPVASYATYTGSSPGAGFGLLNVFNYLHTLRDVFLNYRTTRLFTQFYLIFYIDYTNHSFVFRPCVCVPKGLEVFLELNV